MDNDKNHQRFLWNYDTFFRDDKAIVLTYVKKAPRAGIGVHVRTIAGTYDWSNAKSYASFSIGQALEIAAHIKKVASGSSISAVSEMRYSSGVSKFHIIKNDNKQLVLGLEKIQEGKTVEKKTLITFRNTQEVLSFISFCEQLPNYASTRLALETHPLTARSISHSGPQIAPTKHNPPGNGYTNSPPPSSKKVSNVSVQDDDDDIFG